MTGSEKTGHHRSHRSPAGIEAARRRHSRRAGADASKAVVRRGVDAQAVARVSAAISDSWINLSLMRRYTSAGRLTEPSRFSRRRAPASSAERRDRGKLTDPLDACMSARSCRCGWEGRCDVVKERVQEELDPSRMSCREAAYIVSCLGGVQTGGRCLAHRPGEPEQSMQGQTSRRQRLGWRASAALDAGWLCPVQDSRLNECVMA